MYSHFRLAFVEHYSVPLMLCPGAYTYINCALLLSIVSKIYHPQAHRSGFTSTDWHRTLSTLASTLSYRGPENSGVLKKEKIVAKELKDMIQLKQVKSSDTSGASTLTQSSRSGVVWVDSGVEAMSMVLSAGTWGKSSLLRFTTVRPMGAEIFVLEATEKLTLQKDRVPLVNQVAMVSQKTIAFDAMTSQALSLPRNTVQPVQILPKTYFQVLGMTDLPTFKFRHVRLSVESFSGWRRKIHDIHSQVWRFCLLCFSHGKGEEGKKHPIGQMYGRKKPKAEAKQACGAVSSPPSTDYGTHFRTCFVKNQIVSICLFDSRSVPRKMLSIRLENNHP